MTQNENCRNSTDVCCYADVTGKLLTQFFSKPRLDGWTNVFNQLYVKNWSLPLRRERKGAHIISQLIVNVSSRKNGWAGDANIGDILIATY